MLQNAAHAEIASTLDIASFGGTGAEKMFWEENLICGQALAPPATTSPFFRSYKLNQNRCCREVGKKLTMFSSGASEDQSVRSLVLNESTSLLAATYSTNEDNRYSRYEILGALDSNLTENEFKQGSYQLPFVQDRKLPNKFQWRTFHDTGRKTCCGGGFVRKFADGTNDWKQRNRFTIDPKKFACLNYRNELHEAFKNEEIKRNELSSKVWKLI